MAHIGEEGRLGAASFLGLVSCPLQLDDAALSLGAQEELSLTHADREALRVAEKEDLRSDVLLLIAERKLDRRPIGSMRLEPNFTGPLRIEAETTLPERFRGKQLVELTRLGVDNGNAGALVMAALAKAAFEICSAGGIDYTIAVGRRSMGEMFRSLCFDAIEGPISLSYAKTVPFWIYALPVAEWEPRLRERGHFYFEFMARTDHPDIDIDYDRVLAALGGR